MSRPFGDSNMPTVHLIHGYIGAGKDNRFASLQDIARWVIDRTIVHPENSKWAE